VTMNWFLNLCSRYMHMHMERYLRKGAGANQSNERYNHDLHAWNLWLQLSSDRLVLVPFCGKCQTLAYSARSIWLCICRIQGLNLRSFMWIEFLFLWIQFLSLPALLTITTLTNQWRIQDFEVRL